MRRWLIVGAASLAACASGKEAGGPISAAWLVGGWVPRGQHCESDAGVLYRADGTWTAYGSAGTWRIEGARLISYVIEEWEDEEPPVRLAAPEKHVQDIERIGPDAYRSAGQDGSAVELTRCHADPR